MHGERGHGWFLRRIWATLVTLTNLDAVTLANLDAVRQNVKCLSPEQLSNLSDSWPREIRLYRSTACTTESLGTRQNYQASKLGCP